MSTHRVQMARAVCAFLGLFVLGAQVTQSASGYFVVSGLGNTGTLIAARFQVPFVLVLVAALALAIRQRSVAVFLPGRIRLQVLRAFAQAGQSLFLLIAATQLRGSVLAALTLALVPTVLAAVALWSGRHGHSIGRWAMAPASYGVAATFLIASGGALSAGSAGLGALCALLAAMCTAGLHLLTDRMSREHFLTSMLFQTSVGALVSIPLWCIGGAWQVVPLASMPALGWVLLLVVVSASTAQQQGLQWAYRLAPLQGMVPLRLNTLRGVQVFFGAGFDAILYGVLPGVWGGVALAITAAAIWVSWRSVSLVGKS